MEISNPARPLPAAGLDHANLFRLDGKSYVVLGAGSGLGEHVARTIVGLGGRVLGVDINPEPLRSLAEELGMPFLVADATSEDGAAAIAEAVVAEFGQINGYVDVIGQMHRNQISGLLAGSLGAGLQDEPRPRFPGRAGAGAPGFQRVDCVRLQHRRRARRSAGAGLRPGQGRTGNLGQADGRGARPPRRAGQRSGPRHLPFTARGRQGAQQP